MSPVFLGLGFDICCLCSSNGTFLDGEKIGKGKRRLITHGAELSFGVAPVSLADKRTMPPVLSPTTLASTPLSALLFRLHLSFDRSEHPQEARECARGDGKVPDRRHSRKGELLSGQGGR